MPSTDKQDVKNITDTEKNWHDTKDTTGKNYNLQDTDKNINLSNTEKNYNLQGSDKSNVQSTGISNFQDKGKSDFQDTGVNKFQGTDKNYNYQDTGKFNLQGNQIKQDPLHEDTKDVNLQGVQNKEDITTASEKINARFKMNDLLRQAHESLQRFVNPELDVVQQIPVKLLSTAKGIIFLTVIKGGLIIGGAVGSGVMITRLDDRKWSGPCAIGLTGIQFGLNIGGQKTDHIIILRDNSAVEVFARKGQLKFGADSSIAVGPSGRDSSVALSINEKGYTSSVWYSMGTGLYLGISLEGQVIYLKDDFNEEFYGNKVEPSKIFDGTATIPEEMNYDYDSICKLLNDYILPPQKNLGDIQQSRQF